MNENLMQDELINHLKVHAGSRTVKGAVDKKFMCNQCEKKFFTRKLNGIGNGLLKEVVFFK